MVNKLCRRYLGMPKDLTLTFTGGGIDEDAQVRAQTDQVLIFSGQKTLNDVRAENGDSLYEFPEANMPFINTASGPEFLEGASIPDPVATLGPDGQPLPPKVGPDGKPLPPKPPGKPAIGAAKKPGKPSTDAPSGDEVNLQKADEIDAFLTFERNQRRYTRPWRDFTFKTVEPELAKVLNVLGEAGDLEAIKVLAAAVPKGLRRLNWRKAIPTTQDRGWCRWTSLRCVADGRRGVDDHHVTVVFFGKDVTDELADGLRQSGARGRVHSGADDWRSEGGYGTFPASESSDWQIPVFDGPRDRRDRGAPLRVRGVQRQRARGVPSAHHARVRRQGRPPP